MRTRIPIAAVAAVTSLLFVAGCGSTDGTPAPASSSGVAGPVTDEAVTEAVTTTPDPREIPTTVTESGPCLDRNSALVSDAIGTLGADSYGGTWVPTASSDEQTGNCPDLLWMSVDGTGIGDATYRTQVLFFHDGRYLGTATAQPYSYTHVVGSDARSVSVQYRWLDDDDPFCCPQGGPSVVTFTWDGDAVVANGQFPPS